MKKQIEFAYKGRYHDFIYANRDGLWYTIVPSPGCNVKEVMNAGKLHNTILNIIDQMTRRYFVQHYFYLDSKSVI